MASPERSPNLFDWAMLDDIGDLERLIRVITFLPDEPLIDQLVADRKGRRNDYPVDVMFNCLIAGVVYNHPTVASLIRELKRNAQLRSCVGINPVDGVDGVPSKDAFSRFIQKMCKPEYQRLLEKMRLDILNQLSNYLDNFGTQLAIDSTDLSTYASPTADPADSSDPEAGWGKKASKDTDNGDEYYWLGYKLHMIVDAEHELPLDFLLTSANRHDNPFLKPLVGSLLFTTDLSPETLAADKAYDDTDVYEFLWNSHNIKPIIPCRDYGTEEKPLNPHEYDNVYLNKNGQLICHELAQYTDEVRKHKMVHHGFEKKRNAHKFRCPARYYGFDCEYINQCGNGASDYGRVVRVPVERDIRRFPPVARDTYKWDRLYKKRVAVERDFNLLKDSFTLGDIRWRSKAKIHLKSSLAILVMLTLALSEVAMQKSPSEGKKADLRQLYQMTGRDGPPDLKQAA